MKPLLTPTLLIRPSFCSYQIHTMDDQNNNPSATPSPAAVGRRFDRNAAAAEEDGLACTGKSCQSCTAGAIADCVAVCCCPCAVVNIFVLAFFKLPYAVARRCLRDRRERRRRRRMLECGRRDRDRDVISEEGKLESDVRVSGSGNGEEVWVEVGHLGFGRVSFTGINFHTKAN